MKNKLSIILLSSLLLVGCAKNDSITTYTLSLSSDSPSGTVYGKGTYISGQEVTISTSNDPIYAFIGWYEDNELISKNTTYSFVINKDTSLIAKYTDDYTIVDLTSDNSSCKVFGSGTYKTNSNINLLAIADNDYAFVGWYEDNKLIAKDNPYSIKLDKKQYSLVGHFESILHEVFVDVNDASLGKVEGFGTYKKGDLVTLKATSYTNNIFKGFYDDKDNLLSDKSTYSFVMNDSSYVIKALFEPIKYKLSTSIYNKESDIYSSRLGSVSFFVDDKEVKKEDNECYFAPNTKVVLKATPNRGYKFDCWAIKENNKVTILSDSTLEVTIKDKDIHYEARFVSLNEGSSLYIGSYPQSRVPFDAPLIDDLNKLIKNTPSKDDTSWKLMDDKSMWYQDVALDDVYYRGVYFNEYKGNQEEETSNQYLNGYFKNTLYWFRFEPILWNVNMISNKKIITLQSDIILDAKAFMDDVHDLDEGVFANNYKNSSIRAWLNSTFYDVAFKDDSYLTSLEIKNDYISAAVSGDFIYTCDNTLDKVYLMSQQEALNLYSSSRQLHASDYAKMKGVNVSSITTNMRSPWLLRSPSSSNGDNVCYILDDGSTYGKEKADYPFFGIVPCISLDISLF